jgi:DNA mismatch repair protein MutL
LTHREHSALLESKEDLALCGFEIEDFGNRSVQVRAVPMVMGAAQMKGFWAPTAEQKRNVLIQMACKKAVKAGDPLPPESVAELIRQMQETGAPPTCPHGRPIVVRIAKADIDKRFRRT